MGHAWRHGVTATYMIEGIEEAHDGACIEAWFHGHKD